MATRVIDDTKLNNIAVAIQAKDNGGQMTVDEMPGRIQAIPSGSAIVLNPALVLWDWEGTKLAEYSLEDALALTELPAPDTLPPYAAADHELLVFQSWNWSLSGIKAWIQAHEGETLDVGAIYTTTDGYTHQYWANPRLSNISDACAIKIADTNIGSYRFANSKSVARVSISGNVVSIGNNAFYFDQCLTHVNIPNGITSIPTEIFNACRTLSRVILPNSVTSIGDYALANITTLLKIIIPDGVTSIGNSAFRSGYSLKRVDIPAGVTSIGNNVFEDCISLTEMKIPNGVTSIGSSAFRSCQALNKINIPSGVTSIGGYAFYGCSVLCDILNESQAALSNTNAFNQAYSGYRIYVPRAYLSWYETETNWSTIYTQGHIVAIEDNIAYLESIGFNVDAYKGV